MAEYSTQSFTNADGMKHTSAGSIMDAAVGKACDTLRFDTLDEAKAAAVKCGCAEDDAHLMGDAHMVGHDCTTMYPAPMSSIVELAIATSALSTLVSVLTMPDYAPVLAALSGDGPFTVFAPTDAAFAASGVDLTDVETVTAVLKYHVVSGAIPSSALAPKQSVATLQGEEVEVTVTADGVFVNGGAQVVTPDVMASNGVVHVIDALLMPPTLVPDVGTASRFTGSMMGSALLVCLASYLAL
jgi:uncharacterized surface protein with fasciclin (FAS1) repeats